MKQLEKLIKGLDEITEKEALLFCFPYAGGGASVFKGWGKGLAKNIKVCPIQLPGREERIMEAPYLDMEELIKDMVQVILPYQNHPMILFGHSMGAKIAFEVERMLEMNNKKSDLLIVSGSRVPHIPEPNPICHLPDEKFEQELARFEGTPKEILENKELLRFFIPMLRADFTMDESYYTKDIVRLNCPLVAFGADRDEEANQEELKKWDMYADSGFSSKIFSGGHFFIREQEENVIQAVQEEIDKIFNPAYV